MAELPRLTYSYTVQHADEAGRPQQSAIQTPQAPGGQRGKPSAGRRRPKPDRYVLFTDDAQGRKKQEPVPIFGGEPIVTNENGDL